MKKEFEIYQDEEGNVYTITTELEQLIIQDLYKAMKRNNEKQDEIERLNKELKQEKKDFKEANDKCFKLISENKRLKRQIKIKDEWCDRIWEIGTDYDGYGNNLKELKNLVDELIEYSNKAKRCDDKCVAYISYENGKEIKENILMEELGGDKK